MRDERVDGICALLKGIETGDPDAVRIIHPTAYIQHNPQTQTGRDGLAALFARLSKTSPRVNVVRAFSDGDFVFGHTEYDFDTQRVGFEVFRFEGDFAVEHWDNIQPRRGPNASGHGMVDGPTDAQDLDRTEANRAIVEGFVQRVLVGGEMSALDSFISPDGYTEHDPEGEDGLPALRDRLHARTAGDQPTHIERLHRVLAQGDFVLAVCEGTRAGLHTAFYDLYRVASGRIVEHWNTVETVPPPDVWQHDNGKF